MGRRKGFFPLGVSATSRLGVGRSHLYPSNQRPIPSPHFCLAVGVLLLLIGCCDETGFSNPSEISSWVQERLAAGRPSSCLRRGDAWPLGDAAGWDMIFSPNTLLVASLRGYAFAAAAGLLFMRRERLAAVVTFGLAATGSARAAAIVCGFVFQDRAPRHRPDPSVAGWPACFSAIAARQ